MLVRRMYWWCYWWLHFLIKISMFLAFVMIFNGQSGKKSVPKYKSTRVCAYIFSLLVSLDVGGFTHMLQWCCFSGVAWRSQWQLWPPLGAVHSPHGWVVTAVYKCLSQSTFLADSFCKYTQNISGSTLLLNTFLWPSIMDRRTPQHIRP